MGRQRSATWLFSLVGDHKCLWYLDNISWPKYWLYNQDNKYFWNQTNVVPLNQEIFAEGETTNIPLIWSIFLLKISRWNVLYGCTVRCVPYIHTELFVDCWFFIVDLWQLTVDCWLGTVYWWLSTVDCGLIILNCWLLTVYCWLVAVFGDCFLVTGDCWLLKVESWL